MEVEMLAPNFKHASPPLFQVAFCFDSVSPPKIFLQGSMKGPEPGELLLTNCTTHVLLLIMLPQERSKHFMKKQGKNFNLGAKCIP